MCGLHYGRMVSTTPIYTAYIGATLSSCGLCAAMLHTILLCPRARCCSLVAGRETNTCMQQCSAAGVGLELCMGLQHTL